MTALRRARARQDALVGHFRTLIGGFRELKLHRGRREAFLAESLEPDHRLGPRPRWSAA